MTETLSNKRKNTMSEWITDKTPGQIFPGAKFMVWVTRASGKHLVEAREVMKGEPWCYPPEPEPYVKPTRFRAEYDENIGYYVLITDNMQYGTSLPYLWDKDAHKEVAERIVAIYEEMFP